MNRSEFLNKKRILLLKSFCFVILLIIISIFVFPRSQTSVHIPKQILIPSKTHSIRCIVFIFRRSGRFGNRMFIIATGYALARLHSCHLYLSSSILKEMKSVFVFDLSHMLLPHSTFKSIRENRTHPMKNMTKDIGCQYLPELTHPNAISSGTIFEIRGYWQSYLHFANYSKELREHIFVATQPILVKVSKFFIDLYQQQFGITVLFSLENHQSLKRQLTQSNKTTWIGIHIRRIDFVYYKFASSDEPLFNAIEYYTTRYPNAHFVLASDDKSYCKNLFHDQSNIFFTPRSFSRGDDLITLSLCQHSIITGGTFGWWSAYLANGEVVHDTVYPTTCEKDEYYYPPWFRTDVDIILDKHTL